MINRCPLYPSRPAIVIRYMATKHAKIEDLCKSDLMRAHDRLPQFVPITPDLQVRIFCQGSLSPLFRVSATNVRNMCRGVYVHTITLMGRLSCALMWGYDSTLTSTTTSLVVSTFMESKSSRIIYFSSIEGLINHHGDTNTYRSILRPCRI